MSEKTSAINPTFLPSPEALVHYLVEKWGLTPKEAGKLLFEKEIRYVVELWYGLFPLRVTRLGEML